MKKFYIKKDADYLALNSKSGHVYWTLNVEDAVCFDNMIDAETNRQELIEAEKGKLDTRPFICRIDEKNLVWTYNN